MRTIALIVVASLCPWCASGQQGPTSRPATVTAETARSPLEFTVTDIDGKEVPLARYRGRVLLIVNVASKCGLTPQYQQLQELYERNKDRGLSIAAFPANNFREQEPGTNQEIKAFCDKNYAVTFDLFSKVSAKGDDTCELYKYLTSKDKNGEFGGEIAWNFTKFLVSRNGKVIARFEPKTRPDDPELVRAIQHALEQTGGTETRPVVKP